MCTNTFHYPFTHSCTHPIHLSTIHPPIYTIYSSIYLSTLCLLLFINTLPHSPSCPCFHLSIYSSTFLSFNFLPVYPHNRIPTSSMRPRIQHPICPSTHPHIYPRIPSAENATHPSCFQRFFATILPLTLLFVSSPIHMLFIHSPNLSSSYLLIVPPFRPSSNIQPSSHSIIHQFTHPTIHPFAHPFVNS